MATADEIKRDQAILAKKMADLNVELNALQARCPHAHVVRTNTPVQIDFCNDCQSHLKFSNTGQILKTYIGLCFKLGQ